MKNEVFTLLEKHVCSWLGVPSFRMTPLGVLVPWAGQPSTTYQMPVLLAPFIGINHALFTRNPHPLVEEPSAALGAPPPPRAAELSKETLPLMESTLTPHYHKLPHKHRP